MKILLFEAIWCRDCKIMRPLWRNLKLEMPELDIQHFDVDEHKEYCKVFAIFDVPVAIFADKDGKEISRLTGILHKDLVIDLIKKYKNL